MNILLINHYAGSQEHGMEFRPYYLAKEWIKLGHNVTIIAASYSHLRNKNIDLKCKQFHLDIIDGIQYYWVKTDEYDGNGFKRLKNTFQFSLWLYKNARFIAKNTLPDVVIASSPHPFIIYGAKRIADIGGSKLIFEVRDLWPLSLTELHGISANHPFIRFMKWTEIYSYKNADHIVTLLPNSFNYIQELGGQNIHYIPNAINIEEWELSNEKISSSLKNLLDKLKNGGYFIIGYTGTIGVANSLEPLIKAAARLQNEKVAFVIVGEGDQKENLLNLSKSLKNVYFVGRINKKSIPDMLSYFDAVYLGWKKSKLYEYGVSPNKLMDYMMAGKPIIHAIDSEHDLVEKYGCGVSVEAENDEEISKAVLFLKSLDIHQLSQMGENGRRNVVEKHNYSQISKVFLDVMSGGRVEK